VYLLGDTGQDAIVEERHAESLGHPWPLYRAKTGSQARDLQVDPPTRQGMITWWPRDCST
jgi:hypothetical protein